MNTDNIYLDAAKEIIAQGKYQFNQRTQQGTFERKGMIQRYDLTDNKFPLLTTKKMFTRGISHELVWFLNGDTNIKYLVDNDVNIWNEWAYENFRDSRIYNGETEDEFISMIRENKNGFAQEWGELGPIYGKQWRSWEGDDGVQIDQLKRAVRILREDPSNRGNIVSAWNVKDLEKMSLRPCHCLYQLSAIDGELTLQLFQRSADWLLGVPFNIASYAMLTTLFANETSLKPDEFIHSFGNAHIYLGNRKRSEFYKENHDELVKRIESASSPEDYLETRRWVMENAPLNLDSLKTITDNGVEKYRIDDHLPFFLTQFSREPKEEATLEIASNTGLFNANFRNIDKVNGYKSSPRVDFEHNGNWYTPGIAI